MAKCSNQQEKYETYVSLLNCLVKHSIIKPSETLVVEPYGGFDNYVSSMETVLRVGFRGLSIILSSSEFLKAKFLSEKYKNFTPIIKDCRDYDLNLLPMNAIGNIIFYLDPTCLDNSVFEFMEKIYSFYSDNGIKILIHIILYCPLQNGRNRKGKKLEDVWEEFGGYMSQLPDQGKVPRDYNRRLLNVKEVLWRGATDLCDIAGILELRRFDCLHSRAHRASMMYITSPTIYEENKDWINSLIHKSVDIPFKSRKIIINSNIYKDRDIELKIPICLVCKYENQKDVKKSLDRLTCGESNHAALYKWYREKYLGRYAIETNDKELIKYIEETYYGR